MRRSAMESCPKLNEQYRILGKIGEGTYGLVYKATEHPNPAHLMMNKSSSDEQQPLMVFAIKQVKAHKEGKNEVVLSMATLREIKLLKELKHDNIVHLHDVWIDPIERSLALVFEYAHHDLRDIIIQTKHRRLPEYSIRSLMYQILKGVKYMHDNWILHRDMKPQNILVVGQGRLKGRVKIADFGLARIYQSPIKSLSEVERVVVTLWYRAPELLLGAKHYTKAVDIWSTGCIFGEMLNNRELFCGKEVDGSNGPFQKDQCDKIFRVLGLPSWPGLDRLPEYAKLRQMKNEKAYPVKSELRSKINWLSSSSSSSSSSVSTSHQSSGQQHTDMLYDLISRMLELNPEKRITAEDALAHPYFSTKVGLISDRAFDPPGEDPLSFQMQTVHPLMSEPPSTQGTKRPTSTSSHKGTGGPPTNHNNAPSSSSTSGGGKTKQSAPRTSRINSSKRGHSSSTSSVVASKRGRR